MKGNLAEFMTTGMSTWIFCYTFLHLSAIISIKNLKSYSLTSRKIEECWRKFAGCGRESSRISGLLIEPRLNKSKQQHKIIHRVEVHKQSGFWQGRAFQFLYCLAGVMYSNEGHQEELWCLGFFFPRILTITKPSLPPSPPQQNLTTKQSQN